MKIYYKVWNDITDIDGENSRGYMCFTDTNNAGKKILWGIEGGYIPKLLVIARSFEHVKALIDSTYDRIRDNALKGIKSGYIEL